MACGRFSTLLTNLASEHALALRSQQAHYEQQISSLHTQLRLVGLTPKPCERPAESALEHAKGESSTSLRLIDLDNVSRSDSNLVVEAPCQEKQDLPATAEEQQGNGTAAAKKDGRQRISIDSAVTIVGIEDDKEVVAPRVNGSMSAQPDYHIMEQYSSPQTHRDSFRLKESWNKDLDSVWATETLKPGGKHRKAVAQPETEDGDPFEQKVKGPLFAIPQLSSLVISPNGHFRMVWDILGMLFIGYDLIMIPFMQAFQPEPSPALKAMDAVLLYFWTLDMFQSTNVGFYQKGEYINSHKRIMWNYFKTWMLVDLIVVGPEWMSLFLGSGDAFGGLGRMLKGARAIRILRLLRLLKLQRMINMVYDLLESEYTFIVVNLVKLLTSVLVLNHLIACLWYHLGKSSRGSHPRNWIDVGQVDAQGLAYSYTTSLHWSLTQFTPASMDISARNTVERIFSIVVLFFALVAFSSIVASITGAMTSLRNLKNDQDKQFWLLRRYLRQSNIKNELSSRIVKFLEYQAERQTTIVPLSSIKMMSGLSQELSRELAYNMNSQFLDMHPFFRTLQSFMQVMMERLCFQAMKCVVYAEEENVFQVGDEAHRMYFVKSGDLIYLHNEPVVELDPPPAVKEWASEQILWTSWRHRGTLKARLPSDLIDLPAEKFRDIMAVHPTPWSYAKEYGVKYVEWLNCLTDEALLDLLRHETFYEHAAATFKENGDEDV
eukprot:TRINITY_DN29929_c0_g1_i1.p1 TRINITY_DN29929_c0_g1~~TRINITY_DN29929_c0_g1_i1.p1  ORF type:complete len:718 (-),score=121.91 TRINITY_DN29929_c0_g1_i1:211-2364(-)